MPDSSGDSEGRVTGAGPPSGLRDRASRTIAPYVSRLRQPAISRLIVLVNLLLALFGGLVTVAPGGQGLRVASLVAFISVFGIARRNGALLISYYGHLMRDEGLPNREAVFRGSHERLAPVLMTALMA